MIDELWRRVVNAIPSKHFDGERRERAFGFRHKLAHEAIVSQNLRYLEVGVRRGHSLALATLGAGDRLDYALGIDVWMEGYGDEPQHGADGVMRSLAGLGVVTEHIELMTASSHDVLPQLASQGELFNLILIDGDHEPPGAERDVVDAWKLLAPDGLMLFDDADAELGAVWRTFVDERRTQLAYSALHPSEIGASWGVARRNGK